MEVANIQVSQNISKPQPSVKAKPELFSQLLSDAIDTEAPGFTSDETSEETSDKVMEMMMGMLNLNLPLQNYVSSTNADEIILVEQAGIVDTEAIKLSNMMLGMEDTENVGALGESSMIVENEFSLLEEVGKTDFAINENNNSDEMPKQSLVSSEESAEDTLPNTVKPEHSYYNQIQNSAELDISNHIQDLGIEETSIETDIVTEVKTDEKTNVFKKDIDHNLMDNVQVRSFNNIADETVEIKEVTLSDDNIQRVNDSILQLVESTKEGDTNILKVKLYPEDLGTVDVTVKMEEGKLTAKILVDNEQVKGMFTRSITELNESLLKQNIQVEKINVDLNLGTSPDNLNQGFDFNQHGSFNQGSYRMRNNNLRSFYSSAESPVKNESDIHKTGELSILA
ncbi:flagellar hook-length control protein FliK [Tissierella sp. Yu-01]|uniref:flagellar hook-length control protein FliK n=1 Tax=Tissierella sp. Yu-01 TaxID=3035694 RepID=UPI00240DE8E4|nr:flagellar hook-length control protein FliK [Tissierella sp. Yu-01]WFA07896.1 flagellar hook-length control protein FliK [Tissierella sp. Yu-01]